MPSWIKVIGSKTFTKIIADIYARIRMNIADDIVLSKSPNFMDFGISSVNTTDELRSVFIPTTRIRRLTGGSNWLLPGLYISQAT